MYKYAFLFTLICAGTFSICHGQLLKATVSKSDSILSLTADMRRDHRIFGYSKPDTASKKMILLSVFTDEVDGNPFKCTYGSYYQTSDMKDMNIKFLGNTGVFIKAAIIKNNNIEGVIYILRKWINFE